MTFIFTSAMKNMLLIWLLSELGFIHNMLPAFEWGRGGCDRKPLFSNRGESLVVRSQMLGQSRRSGCPATFLFFLVINYFSALGSGPVGRALCGSFKVKISLTQASILFIFTTLFRIVYNTFVCNSAIFGIQGLQVVMYYYRKMLLMYDLNCHGDEL